MIIYEFLGQHLILLGRFEEANEEEMDDDEHDPADDEEPEEQEEEENQVQVHEEPEPEDIEGQETGSRPKPAGLSSMGSFLSILKSPLQRIGKWTPESLKKSPQIGPKTDQNVNKENETKMDQKGTKRIKERKATPYPRSRVSYEIFSLMNLYRMFLLVECTEAFGNFEGYFGRIRI